MHVRRRLSRVRPLYGVPAVFDDVRRGGDWRGGGTAILRRLGRDDDRICAMRLGTRHVAELPRRCDDADGENRRRWPV